MRERLWVTSAKEVRKEVLEATHYFRYNIYLGSTKMYHTVQPDFWWKGMKKEIVEFVERCLVCQRVKIEHGKLDGLMQWIEIPEWK